MFRPVPVIGKIDAIETASAHAAAKDVVLGIRARDAGDADEVAHRGDGVGGVLVEVVQNASRPRSGRGIRGWDCRLRMARRDSMGSAWCVGPIISPPICEC